MGLILALPALLSNRLPPRESKNFPATPSGGRNYQKKPQLRNKHGQPVGRGGKPWDVEKLFGKRGPAEAGSPAGRR
jgi:hypothetical protein